jgi:hypothetical protein
MTEKKMKPDFSINQKTAFLKFAVFILLIFIGGIYQTNAQENDKRIAEIRRIYQETNAQINEAEKNFAGSEIFLTELVVNKGGTMYPAVGNFKNTFRFYYTYGNREKNPYPERLLKITVATEHAAQTESAEYLFNPAGQLIFYFEKTDTGAESESRFYFASGKIIRIQRGKRIADINSREELDAPKAVQTQAAKLVGIFRSSLNN